jgi:hypothetical protein
VLVVSQACVPTCPEYMSPCPKPFDVAAWCGDTNCQLDMQPAQCAEFLGCRARRGQKLSIPISRFYASLDAYDLKLSLSSAGCSGVAVAPEEFIVQLDGVAGTPSSLHYANEAVFTWAPFPEAPIVLALTDLFVEKWARWNRAGDARECRPPARVRGFGNGVGLKRLGFCDAESPRRTRQGVRGGKTHRSGLWSIAAPARIST